MVSQETLPVLERSDLKEETPWESVLLQESTQHCHPEEFEEVPDGLRAWEGLEDKEDWVEALGQGSQEDDKYQAVMTTAAEQVQFEEHLGLVLEECQREKEWQELQPPSVSHVYVCVCVGQNT